MKEFVVAGLLISPFVKYALIASLIFIPTRIILVACHFHRWFWHPLLAESAIFMCILAMMNILT